MTPVNVQTSCFALSSALTSMYGDKSKPITSAWGKPASTSVWWNQCRSLSLESAKAESAQRRHLNLGVSVPVGQDVMGNGIVGDRRAGVEISALDAMKF